MTFSANGHALPMVGVRKKTRSRRVGIIDLQKDSPPRGYGDRIYSARFRKLYISITPQAVAVWCRQLGHRVFYANYYGQSDPKGLLPDDLDVVFIGAYTQSSALAYALAKLFQREKTLTVIGGPHAKSFPRDCLRFFDLVVGECDKSLIEDILSGRFDPPAFVTSGRPLTDIPSVEERMPEIAASSFSGGKPSLMSIIPLLASVGCPYRCNFCVDWDNKYIPLPANRLRADLLYLSENWPNVLVGYHDPNFGVRFDETMDTIETIPKERRNPYIMESSLSILKESRLHRLRETKCVYVAPGIESWSDYSNKTGTVAKSGREKLEQVTSHFHLLSRYVPGFQGNFVFGTDADRGREPVELTKEFIRRNPFVWPAINIPIPYGGTPLHAEYLAEGRILKAIPFAFYFVPYLVTTLANYHPAEFYEHLIDIYSEIASARAWVRRFLSGAPWLVKFVHAIQTFGAMYELAEYRRLKDMLKGDARFRAFHEGRSDTLPEYYQRRFEERLGPYAVLISREERIPMLEGMGMPILEFNEGGSVLRERLRRDPRPLKNLLPIELHDRHDAKVRGGPKEQQILLEGVLQKV